MDQKKMIYRSDDQDSYDSDRESTLSYLSTTSTMDYEPEIALHLALNETTLAYRFRIFSLYDKMCGRKRSISEPSSPRQRKRRRLADGRPVEESSITDSEELSSPRQSKRGSPADGRPVEEHNTSTTAARILMLFPKRTVPKIVSLLPHLTRSFSDGHRYRSCNFTNYDYNDIITQAGPEGSEVEHKYRA